MKLLATIISFSLFALGLAQAGQTQVPSSDGRLQVQIERNGSQLSQKGSAEYFTGAVRIDPLFPVRDPLRASGAYVTFESSARSAWHTPLQGSIY